MKKQLSFIMLVSIAGIVCAESADEDAVAWPGEQVQVGVSLVNTTSTPFTVRFEDFMVDVE